MALMKIGINDLPDFALVEILCRLPSGKFVSQCKFVCKRWFTLISTPNFMDRLLLLRTGNGKKMPVVRTLIDRNAEEFLNRVQSPSSEGLTPMLKWLQNFYRLKKEPVVVGTYDDLILCADGWYYHNDYYICNPCTMEWVALPPPPTHCFDIMPVGIICDRPPNYKEDHRNGHFMQLNDKYRCRVVRILPPNDEFNFDPDGYSNDFNVEIFSSETGKWRELVVSSPQGIYYDALDNMGFAYNGVLYWSGHRDGCFLVLGLDPFTDYECSFTVFDVPVHEKFVVECPTVSGGLVRMSDYDRVTRTLFVWNLKEQDVDSMVEGDSKLCLSKQEVYSLDQKMYPDDAEVVQRLPFDPNNEDIFYLLVDGDIIMCNIRTSKWSKIVEKITLNAPFYFYPLALPWWPTPVPSLSQPHGGGSSILQPPPGLKMSLSARQNTEPINISINELSESILVEILCRLPCGKFVFQCKGVCKRWFSLISSPSFIDHFFRLRIDNQTPVVRTLIDRNGEEFLDRIHSSSKVIPTMLKRLQSLLGLKRVPVVVGTYNDLILCSADWYYQNDYYICNPYTMQWVALPPPPTQCFQIMRAGIICDSSYYREDDQNGHTMQLNEKYRCKVVRILPPNVEFDFDPDGYSYDFNVEIFSSETGKWRELVVSSPQGILYDTLDNMSFAYNGVLYWSGHRDGYFLVLGLDPFNDHECRFTVFDYPEGETFVVECPSVCGGLVRMSDFHRDTRTLFVWDLKEQDHNYKVGGAGKLCLSKHEVYHLDQEMYPDGAQVVQRLPFDPSNEDIFYLQVDGDIIMCNIRTRKWSKIVEKITLNAPFYFYPFVLPWWPTPVPRLPLHAPQLRRGGGASSSPAYGNHQKY